MSSMGNPAMSVQRIFFLQKGKEFFLNHLKSAAIVTVMSAQVVSLGTYVREMTHGKTDGVITNPSLKYNN